MRPLRITAAALVAKCCLTAYVQLRESGVAFQHTGYGTRTHRSKASVFRCNLVVCKTKRVSKRTPSYSTATDSIADSCLTFCIEFGDR